MTAALYARVSTRAPSRPRHHRLASAAAAREQIAEIGDELVGEYLDNGHSGPGWTGPAWTHYAMRRGRALRTGAVPVAGPARRAYRHS